MIVFENQDWLVVDKPTHLSTHGAWDGDLAAVEWLKLHTGQDLFVVSRLDKGTSGVLSFAKTAEASALAQKIHETDKAAKTYSFVSRHTWQDVEAGQEKIVELSLDGKSARTLIRYVGVCAAGHLFEAELSRGRTHQIRRHAAHLGVPLLGDLEHGPDEFYRLMLHCQRVKWPGVEAWKAPLPASFMMGHVSDLAMQSAVCQESRGSWIETQSTAGRLVHRREVTCQDLDFCIDRFGDYLSCWNYSEAPSESKLNLILNPLMQRLGAKGAVIRNINKNSHKSGLFSDQVILGEAPPPEFVVHEFGLKYHVSLTQRQHIGLFLDQRDNRKRVLIESKGKRVLNLFAYTCSFSVCAAAGGCEVVLSVDSAKSALDIGKINFELNELTATGRGKFIVDDVRIFLDRQVRKIQKEGQKALFDIIVCDPPTFSKASNFAAFSVQKEWQDLVLKCAMLCKSDGVVYFSNNHQSESFVAYEKGLKKYFGSVVRLSQPMDFPERQGQDFHVKQFMCKLPLP